LKDAVGFEALDTEPLVAAGDEWVELAARLWGTGAVAPGLGLDTTRAHDCGTGGAAALVGFMLDSRDGGAPDQGRLPHPTAIQRFIYALLEVLEADAQGPARAAVLKHMPPLVVTPVQGGYRVDGAFGIGFDLEEDVPRRGSGVRFWRRRDRLLEFSKRRNVGAGRGGDRIGTFKTAPAEP